MEPNPLQRRLAFGLLVLVLVGLGVYLLGPAARGAGRTATPRVRPAASAAPSPSGPGPGPGAQPGPSAASGPGSAVAAPDIYQWLPFTQAGLAAAASVARRFGDAYGTFTYAENARTYAQPIQQLATAQLAGQVEAAYSLPGVAAARYAARQVSAGSSAVDSIRAFGPASLTFVVQVTENLTTLSGRSQSVTAYAITLTGSGSAWLVSDIELATAGNS
jgi:hypothetical protein